MTPGDPRSVLLNLSYPEEQVYVWYRDGDLKAS